MKPFLALAILIMNGQTYWIPCAQGGVFCPHFDTSYEVLVSTQSAPSMIVAGVNE
jgi:hypothetical protein